MWQKLQKLDWILLGAIFLLLAIGLVVLYSISTQNLEQAGLSIFQRQLIYVALGLGIAFYFALGNYLALKTYATPIYFATLAILIIVLLFGKTVRGTSGWIGFGFFSLQPVELAKLGLIVFMAGFIAEKKMQLGEVGRLVASAVLVGAIIMLVLKQPDFGSAMVLSVIWGVLTLASGVRRKTTFSLALIVAIFALVGWFNLATYQKQRLENLFDPTFDPKGSGYNVNQAIIAIGSGGVWGKGIGHGSQSQLNFLPEKHTDFIYAVVVEELGFWGGGLVLILFLVIFYRIIKIAQAAPDNFGYLVAIGILVLFLVHVWENIGMNLGVMPVTGIPLPFLSYGGSFMLSMLAAVGILQSIHLKKEHLIEVHDSY